MHVVLPTEPRLMLGRESPNSIQIIWIVPNHDLVCGTVTYYVMINRTDDGQLIKHDRTRNTIYTFEGLFPETAYTISVYASSEAGDSRTVVILIRTPKNNESGGKIHFVHICT